MKISTSNKIEHETYTVECHINIMLIAITYFSFAVFSRVAAGAHTAVPFEMIPTGGAVFAAVMCAIVYVDVTIFTLVTSLALTLVVVHYVTAVAMDTRIRSTPSWIHKNVFQKKI